VRTLVPLAFVTAAGGTVVLFARLRRLRPRPAGWAAAVAVTVAFGVLIAMPVGYAVYMTHLPTRRAVHDVDLGAPKRPVTMTTSGGVELRGWYVPSVNGAAVAIMHGTGGNRVSVADHARLLARHGYGVLLFDLHGHGESGGRSLSVGWDAGDDVAAATRYLAARPEVEDHRVGVVGVSLGGEAAIEAMPDLPGVRAAVLEGVQGASTADVRAGGADPLTVASISLMSAVGRVLSGSDSNGTRTELMARVAPRPVLLISAGRGTEAKVNEAMLRHGGDAAELWNLPEGSHADALDADPAGYERRVLDFLDRALS
jgi:pimeloyl-ACP methyl ester carboxylesterase